MCEIPPQIVASEFFSGYYFVLNCRGGFEIKEKIHKMGGSLLSDFGVIFSKNPRKMKLLAHFQKNFIKWVGDYKMLMGWFFRKIAK